MMKQKLYAFLLAAVAGSLLLTTGCMGTNAVTQKVRKANLKVVENRWGREGVFLGLNILWVYRICTVADLLVFNSIEFWTGENVINGQSPLVDMPIEEVREKIGIDVNMAQIERMNDHEAKLYLGFDNGDHLSFDVLRSDEEYTVSYLGREFYRGELEHVAVQ
jgi:hypothetical protein